ncbi:MAG: hypothetical protein R2991_09380 [Thermoanaerobaculia bacterium]
MADKKLTTYEPIEPGHAPKGWGWLLKLAFFVLAVWFVIQKAEDSPEIRQILEFLKEAGGQR